jgi:hypothetical protein
MSRYQTSRDQQVLPMYEFTTELATLEPPPPELQQLLAAMPGNQDAMDGFARVNGRGDLAIGVLQPAERREDHVASRRGDRRTLTCL